MITRIVLPAIALGLAVVAVPAAAKETVAVSYADLDLTKAAGRDALERRLDRAVRTVCGVSPTRYLNRLEGYKTCVAEARASYQSQVELALSNANARRVAVLADKLGLLASF